MCVQKRTPTHVASLLYTLSYFSVNDQTLLPLLWKGVQVEQMGTPAASLLLQHCNGSIFNNISHGQYSCTHPGHFSSTRGSYFRISVHTSNKTSMTVRTFPVTLYSGVASGTSFVIVIGLQLCCGMGHLEKIAHHLQARLQAATKMKLR